MPEKYKFYFKERGGLFTLIKDFEKQNEKKKKIDSLEFEVSDKNFKKIYQSFISLEQFKDKPLVLANYLIQRVPEKNKENFAKWLKIIGCNDSASLVKTLSKWEIEASKAKSVKNDKEIKGRGE